MQVFSIRIKWIFLAIILTIKSLNISIPGKRRIKTISSAKSKFDLCASIVKKEIITAKRYIPLSPKKFGLLNFGKK